MFYPCLLEKMQETRGISQRKNTEIKKEKEKRV